MIHFWDMYFNHIIFTQQMPDTFKDNILIRRGDIVLQKIVHSPVCSPEKPRSLDIIERIGGDIRSGSLKYFFNHVLPPLKPELDVDHVYNSCVRGKVLSKKRGSKEYTWKGIHNNTEGNKDHKIRLINIFRAVNKAVRTNNSTSPGTTPVYFDILDNNSKVKPRSNWNDDQDSTIYLQDTLESLPDTSEEERLYNTSFSFHLKSSNSKNDVYDVRFILYPIINTNLLHL